MARLSDAHELPPESRDALNTPACIMHLFGKLHTAHGSKIGKHIAAVVGWTLWWVIQHDTDAELEAEA